MKNLKKKGFTIVELVIVIAVIAILSAVLIPTFSSLIRKANVSADTQLVKQLNQALAIEEITLGKNETMYEALEKVKEYGFDVAKINAKANLNEILWDSKNDCFAYYNEDESKVQYIPEFEGTAPLDNEKYMYWIISSEVHSEYSTYLIDKEGEIETSKGIDTTECSNVTSITYKNEGTAQNVVIRTNSGILTVIAPNDTVKHYGEGSILNIDAVASASYHEFGFYPKAIIKQGRLVVEDTGNIPAVEINAIPTAENQIKIQTNKDVVVSASQEIIDQLGSNKLPNVEVKVSNSSAKVAIDDKIDSSKIEVNGSAIEDKDLLTIKKVGTYSDLVEAINDKEAYIMLTSDITYPNGESSLNILSSMTLDGNGYTLSGYGKRGNNNTSIAINNNGTDMIDVTLRNLTVSNDGENGRVIETRGNLNSLTIESCVLNGSDIATSSNITQNITIGGNQATIAKVEIIKSKISASHYGIISFNPIDLNVTDSEFNCWAALYMKGENSSAGSRGSKVSFKNSLLNCQNYYEGDSNNFGALVFEDGNIDAYIENCFINVTANKDASQSAVVFNEEWASDGDLKSVNVSFKDTTIKGNINEEAVQYDKSNTVVIYSGQTTNNPNIYLADGSTITSNGLFFEITPATNNQ